MSKRLHKEQESNRKPVGLFDIDGCLTQGYTILSFAGYLHSHGLFSSEAWTQMLTNNEDYKKSKKNHTAYHKLAINLVKNYAKGLENQNTKEVEHLALLFLEESLKGNIDGYQILNFAKPLVETINQRVGKTIAISGSPVEALLPIIQYLGFDQLQATTIEIRNGVFTGNPAENMALDETKRKAVNHLSGHIDMELSFAFGDTLHDLPFLEATQNPFIVGNNSSLQKFGIEKDWPIHQNGEGILEAVNERINNLLN